MKRFLLTLGLLLASLGVVSSAKAQSPPDGGTNGYYRDVSLRWNGVSLVPNAGVQVTICADTAIIIPCTPIPIWKDQASTIPQSNPITTAVDGSWDFWAPPGFYVYGVTGTGLNKQGPILITVTGMGGSGGDCILSSLSNNQQLYNNLGTCGGEIWLYDSPNSSITNYIGSLPAPTSQPVTTMAPDFYDINDNWIGCDECSEGKFQSNDLKLQFFNTDHTTLGSSADLQAIGQLVLSLGTTSEASQLNTNSVIFTDGAGNSAGALLAADSVSTHIGTQMLFEAGDGSNNYVSLTGPPTLSATNSYTLPNAFPAMDSGYFLTSDTMGIMSWAPAGGACTAADTEQLYSNMGACAGEIWLYDSPNSAITNYIGSLPQPFGETVTTMTPSSYDIQEQYTGCEDCWETFISTRKVIVDFFDPASMLSTLGSVALDGLNNSLVIKGGDGVTDQSQVFLRAKGVSVLDFKDTQGLQSGALQGADSGFSRVTTLSFYGDDGSGNHADIQAATTMGVTPAPLCLPKTTGSANQFLQTDGGTTPCQQTSWATVSGGVTFSGSTTVATSADTDIASAASGTGVCVDGSGNATTMGCSFGSIGGSIASTEIAFGNTTANTIHGSLAAILTTAGVETLGLNGTSGGELILRGSTTGNAPLTVSATGGILQIPLLNSVMDLTLTGTLTDGSASVGTSGYCLTSTGTGTSWANVCGGGSTGISGATSGQLLVAGSATTATSSKAIQGTDTNILSAGTISGTGATLCTTANGGATTSGCTTGGISGLTTGQVPIAGSSTTLTSSKALQGTDTKILTAGTVSGTSVILCTDSLGGATTTSCPSGNGLSGMSVNQVAIAATATTVTSSKAIQGTDTNLLSSGTVSGTSVLLCTDANGGATTVSCPTPSALSGMVAGQIPVAATASTVTSSLATTGTGNVVRATSPTLVTPSLGTPTVITLTNGTGLPANGGLTGQTPIANGGTNSATAAGALINLLPGATRVGDILYCSTFSAGCTAWSLLPGNTGSIQFLQETSSGVPSWANPAVAGVALSALTAATATNTIANGNRPQIWNSALASNNESFLTLGETTAATGGTIGNQDILSILTTAGSTASPLKLMNSLSGVQILPTLHITPTWNTTGVVDAGILENVTNTASGSGSKLMDLQVGGFSKFSVDKVGAVAIADSETIAGNEAFYANPPSALTDGATITLSAASEGNPWFTVTLGGNRTLAVSGMVAGGNYKLFVTQPSSGGPWTLSLGSGCTWKTPASGLHWSPVANTTDLLSWFYDGTNCFVVQGTITGSPSSGTASNIAGTNFGSATGTTNLISSVPSTGVYNVGGSVFVSTAGTSCSAATNSATLTWAWTDATGTSQTSTGPLVSVTGNSTLGATTVSSPLSIVAQSGSAISYSIASTLGSTGCATVPQYQAYVKSFN